MRSPTLIAVSLLGWLAAWGFWLSLTFRFHPSMTLALIVTTSLIVAFAAASYLDQLVLVPKLWVLKKRWQYVIGLAATMIAFTAAALCVIRVSYHELHGPDADPLGAIKHFFIDLFGMAVHVFGASLMVTMTNKIRRVIEQRRQGDSQ